MYANTARAASASTMTFASWLFYAPAIGCSKGGAEGDSKRCFCEERIDDVNSANDDVIVSNDDAGVANDEINVSNDEINVANDEINVSNDEINVANDHVDVRNDVVDVANDVNIVWILVIDVRIPDIQAVLSAFWTRLRR